METLKKIYERNKELDHIFMKKYEAAMEDDQGAASGALCGTEHRVL